MTHILIQNTLRKMKKGMLNELQYALIALDVNEDTQGLFEINTWKTKQDNSRWQ